MPDTKRNERLAIKMGWKTHLEKAGEGTDTWCVLQGEPHEFRGSVPDFSGDICAAVKWLLPYLDGLFLYWKIERVSIGSDDRRLYFSGRTQGVSGTDICVGEDLLSLALASAVEAVERLNHERATSTD